MTMHCTGNDLIVVIEISEEYMNIYSKNEKFESIGMMKSQARSLRCSVNELGTEIYFGEYLEKGTIIENICTEFYRVCTIKTRNMEEDRILKAFQVFLNRQILYHKSKWKYNNTLTHYALLVANTWDSMYFLEIKEHFLQSEFVTLKDSCVVLHHSEALMRYLQNPQSKIAFKNGENYIVLYFRSHQTLIYAYEIGKPIRGLKNVLEHTLVKYQSIEAYSSHVIRQKLLQYLSLPGYDANTIVDYCINKLFFKSSDNGHLSDFIPKELILNPDTFTRLKLIKAMDVIDFISKPLSDSIALHFNCYYDTKIIKLYNVDFFHERPVFMEKMLRRLSKTLTGEYKFIKAAGRHRMTSCSEGAMRIVQDQLRLHNYVPRISSHSHKIRYVQHIHIDVQWNKIKSTYSSIDSMDHTVHSKEIILECPTVNQCFLLSDSVYGSTIRDIVVSPEFIQFMRLLLHEHMKRAVEVEDKDAAIHIKPTQIRQFFRLYLESIQLYIQQVLSSQEYSVDKCQYIITVDQPILDTLIICYDQLRQELTESSKERNITLKLIYREQLSAVYCKQQAKYYEGILDHFDYPKYIVQAHLYPTYINLTLNTVVSLTDKVSSWTDETVLTLKRRRVPFNMLDTMEDYLWNDMLSSDGSNITLCTQHSACDYVSIEGVYDAFIQSFHSYLVDDYMCSEEDIHWYENINMKLSTHCQCRLTISKRDIFDMCVIPTIHKLVSTVMASLYDACLFKEFPVHDVMLAGLPLALNKDSVMLSEIMRIIKWTFQCNKKYHIATIQWLDNDMDSILDYAMQTIIQHPESGLYEQVASGDYSLVFYNPKYPLYWDHHLHDTVEENTHHIIIKKGQRITENDREERMMHVFYCDHSQYVNTKVYFDACIEQHPNPVFMYQICEHLQVMHGLPVVLKRRYYLDSLSIQLENLNKDKDFRTDIFSDITTLCLY